MVPEGPIMILPFISDSLGDWMLYPPYADSVVRDRTWGRIKAALEIDR